MRRVVVLAALLAAAAVPAAPASAQNADLQALIGGRSAPLSLKLKDLDPTWRRVTVGGQFDMGGLTSLFSTFFGGGGGTGVYYTKGQTVNLGGETFIIAYRPQVKPLLDFAALMRGAGGAGGPGGGGPLGGLGGPPSIPEPEPLTGETAVSLSLLNLKTLGSLNDVRQFDLKTELWGGKTAEEVSVDNLQRIGGALQAYLVDSDGVFPNMPNPMVAKNELLPHLSQAAAYVHPETQEPYVANPILSRKKLAHIPNQPMFAAFYEARVGADGKRGVLFVDGNVKRVTAEEWDEIKKASKIQ